MSLVNLAIAHGLLKYNAKFELTHMPFSLDPFLVTHSIVDTMKNSSIIYANLLMSLTQPFLENCLDPLQSKDPFVKILLRIMKNTGDTSQPYRYAIGRNDFFITPLTVPKQVEFNTISVSFPWMSESLVSFHSNLSAQRLLDRAPLENPISRNLLNDFQSLFEYYDHHPSILLMVVQENEQNIFDQLALSKALFETTGILTRRATLQEIGKYAIMRQGHLFYDNQQIGVVYYRAGYAPNDYMKEESIRGRILLEQSDAIKIPDISYQLSGLKVIQAALTDEVVLSSHLLDEQDRKILQKISVFARSLSDKDVYTKVFQNPEGYVVKPQREGGGNNFFGNTIRSLQEDPNFDPLSYIAMERIIPAQHTARLIFARDDVTPMECVSEIGWYTTSHSLQGSINTDIAGYLVRTKMASENEGGVCAGYAALNSLTLK